MDNDKKQKVAYDPDFINSNKHKYSLKEWVRDTDEEPATTNFIEKALMLTSEELRGIMKSISEKVKRRLGD